jgi:gamma-glutamylaminecyclotransferase
VGGATTLFVYGSLRRGGSDHHRLEGAEDLGPARTAPAYRLLSLGAYPGLVDGDGEVAGELWRVDAAKLAELDDYEDHPSLYRRSLVRLDDGRAVEAYLYLGADAAEAEVVAGGDWLRR